jgi:hypothetical protein
MLTQQPKGQLQREYEWKEQIHTKYKDKVIYNIWVNDNGDKNNNSNRIKVINYKWYNNDKVKLPFRSQKVPPYLQVAFITGLDYSVGHCQSFRGFLVLGKLRDK